MEPDNLDIFKKVIFHIPSTATNLTAITVLGTFYSIGMFAAIKLATEIPIQAATIPLLALFLFILPATLSGECLHQLLPKYPRNWGYFLALCNQLILFIYSLILPATESIINAWNVLWLALITVYLANFFVLTLTMSTRYLKRIGLLSLIQPLTVLAAFHIFLGRYLMIPFGMYLGNFMMLGVAAVILIATLFIVEYLVGSNVSNISATGLTAGLLQKKQEALDLGYPTRPDVQTLSIRNQDGETKMAIPWVHPGPLEGFGGGSLANDVIDYLNKDNEGFFLHVPSTHQSDPANPEDNQKILDAIESPEKVDKASKLLKKEFPNATFYGRKIGEKRIIYIDVPDYDDFEISIFQDVIDMEKTTLVDLHQEDMSGTQKKMYYNTSIAEKMRADLKEFIQELEDQEMHEYQAGFTTHLEDKPLFALVEKVNGQKTLLFGIESNGLSENMRKAEDKFLEEFDEVLAFSTDTHASIHDLAKEEHLEISDITDTVKIAEEEVSKAEIGMSHRKAEKMKLLQEDYSSLIFSINIIVRLLPIVLILLYLGLIIWVF